MLVSEPTLIAIISGLAGALVGTGGLAAWFKFGPERRKIIADLHSGLLKDTHDAYHQLSDEFSQLKMANIVLEQEIRDCRSSGFAQERTIKALQEDINRHGRMAELARRKAHIAIHSLGNYELHIEYLLDRMRAENITLNALDRPVKLRRAFQAKMNEVERLESLGMAQAIMDSAADEPDSASE